MSHLCELPWPGNVRQLENAIFRAVVLAESDEIGPGEFPQLAAQAQRHPSAPTAASLVLESEPAPFVSGLAKGGGEPESLSPQLSPDMAQRALPILDQNGDIRPLAEIESELIRVAIAHYDGQMSEVARRLRIGRSTLYRRLKDLGVETGDLTEISSDAVARG